MRKVIGIGETVLDIIFHNGTPSGAVPGGSTFNTMISLGRVGIQTTFVTDLGKDQVGNTIRSFMCNNGVSDTCVSEYFDVQSPVSLAFLDEHNNAQYEFYRQPFPEDPDWIRPSIDADDIIIFGSYYALSPQSRYKVIEVLEQARQKGAIIIYDINFRRNHLNEAIKLTGNLLENLEYADIIRGSDEDFALLWNMTDGATVYRQKTAFYCQHLIYSRGANGADLFTKTFSHHYDAIPLEPVSTIGAGDSFNAGIIWGLLRYRVRRDDLESLSECDWNDIIRCGLSFSANTCMNFENYVDKEFKP